MCTRSARLGTRGIGSLATRTGAPTAWRTPVRPGEATLSAPTCTGAIRTPRLAHADTRHRGATRGPVRRRSGDDGVFGRHDVGQPRSRRLAPLRFGQCASPTARTPSTRCAAFSFYAPLARDPPCPARVAVYSKEEPLLLRGRARAARAHVRDAQRWRPRDAPALRGGLVFCARQRSPARARHARWSTRTRARDPVAHTGRGALGRERARPGARARRERPGDRRAYVASPRRRGGVGVPVWGARARCAASRRARLDVVLCALWGWSVSVGRGRSDGSWLRLCSRVMSAGTA
jgi:hypothetical protein